MDYIDDEAGQINVRFIEVRAPRFALKCRAY
jgi:hypothetical protein